MSERGWYFWRCPRPGPARVRTLTGRLRRLLSRPGRQRRRVGKSFHAVAEPMRLPPAPSSWSALLLGDRPRRSGDSEASDVIRAARRRAGRSGPGVMAGDSVAGDGASCSPARVDGAFRRKSRSAICDEYVFCTRAKRCAALTRRSATYGPPPPRPAQAASARLLHSHTEGTRRRVRTWAGDAVLGK